ncbi:hypothetical protein F5883DRAFT_573701 [Diaporthe sp. PMI_573]|nr:hypothetical protein F5883DRAFT_573701 [Diaporthaceae sp. PMI_573]
MRGAKSRMFVSFIISMLLHHLSWELYQTAQNRPGSVEGCFRLKSSSSLTGVFVFVTSPDVSASISADRLLLIGRLALSSIRVLASSNSTRRLKESTWKKSLGQPSLSRSKTASPEAPTRLFKRRDVLQNVLLSNIHHRMFSPYTFSYRNAKSVSRYSQDRSNEVVCL